jgi:hypothetical protein
MEILVKLSTYDAVTAGYLDHYLYQRLVIVLFLREDMGAYTKNSVYPIEVSK